MCETKERLDGKVAIVTGGSSGMGFEAAKDLAYRGARVVIASRNETKLKIARDQIIEETGNQFVAYKSLDLGSLKSVRRFANEINSGDKVNILINNAGAVALPDVKTADDLNLTMQVNFFGTFLLTYLLLPKLKLSAPSRIINGVAASMYVGDIDFDHWNDVGHYNVISGLASSKLAVALFNAELNRKLKNTGVTAITYDPFVVRDTNILTNVPGIVQNVSQFFINMIGQKKEDVGKQIAYLAAASELEGVSGKHFKFCHEFFNHWSVNDEQLTKKLWEEAKKAVKISDDEDWE
ncbi:retinol dehydrogenase 11-like [Trichoplusia ni]|uniref:Retinol dehydrogenase 11-like n=1 Tax=Trichoplusia ni TaxID=7111 RepID=A0A7E5WMI7_TRINI|nr:retinol dehydrogenase 11-like [Trichoplusia ni]